MRCPHLCLNFWPNTLKLNVRCPPLLLKHLRILCGVPILVWSSDQMSQNWMWGCPPLILKHHIASILAPSRKYVPCTPSQYRFLLCGVPPLPSPNLILRLCHIQLCLFIQCCPPHQEIMCSVPPCSSVPLSHWALSWIISKVENLVCSLRFCAVSPPLIMYVSIQI